MMPAYYALRARGGYQENRDFKEDDLALNTVKTRNMARLMKRRSSASL